jgi:hypothetical protein
MMSKNTICLWYVGTALDAATCTHPFFHVIPTSGASHDPHHHRL